MVTGVELADDSDGNDGRWLSEYFAEVGGLFESFKNHDDIRQKIHELIQSIPELYNSGSHKEAVAAINFYGTKAVQAWSDLVSAIANDCGVGSDEFSAIVSSVWLEDDQERTKCMNDISDDLGIRPLADGDIAKLTKEVRGIVATYMKESDDDNVELDIVQHLTDDYGSYMQQDLRQLVAFMSANTQNMPESSPKDPDESSAAERTPQKYSRLRSVGREALRSIPIAAGVAAGVVVGGVIDRMLRR